MIAVGLILALAGVALLFWCVVIGPMIWVPVAVMLFGFGAMLCGLATVRSAIDNAANRIVAALGGTTRPMSVASAARDTAPAPVVEPTPHPSRRRPTFEELTGKVNPS